MKMKARKKMILKIVIGFVIALAVVSVLYVLSNLGYMIWYIKKAEQRQVRLLCETDHEALLQACRELSRRVATGDLRRPQQYGVRLHPHPAASRFPQPILDLEPTYIVIDPDGSVQIELHGGFVHYGAFAYPEDYKKPYPTYPYGDKQLIDGLWYYDDGYIGHPEYDKRIEALMQKGK